MRQIRLTTAIMILTSAARLAFAVPGTGTLAGAVVGPGAAGLPGVTVTVHGADSAGDRSVVTGEGGEFRVTDLEPGPYSIRSELKGFHPGEAPAVEVAADRVTRVEVTLASATFRDGINVAADSRHATLEAPEVRETGARDLGEALATMPGVWKVRRGGIANDINLRGYRSEDITVLIDGARVAGACPNHMDPPVFHVDFAEVDRIELGPDTGRLAAQGSLGGMVNVVTRKPLEGLHADVAMVAGSFDMTNPSATVSYGDSRFSVLGGYSNRSSDPFTDGSGQSFVEATNYGEGAADAKAYDVSSGWTRIWFAPADRHELGLSYARQEADDVLYPGLKMDAVVDDTDRLTLSYRMSPAGGVVQELRSTVYATRVDHWMTDALRTSGEASPRGISMGTSAATEVAGGTVEVDLGPFTLGLETYLKTWDAWTEMGTMTVTRQYSIPDVDEEVFGLSARWRHDLGRSTQLEAGGRVDRVSTAADGDKANTDLYYAYHGVRTTSRTDTEPSLSLRLVHQLSNSVALSGSLASSVRSPDARERYFALKRMGTDWVGNPELDPPRSNGGALALTWSGGSGSLTASTWADRVQDYITQYGQNRVYDVPGVMSPQAQSYANVDATLVGLSLEGTAALGPRLYLAGSAAWVRGTKDPDPALGLESSALAEIPPLSGRLALRWQSPRFFVEAEGVAAADQERVDSDLDEEATPGWAILNLIGGLNLGQWRLQLVVQNLFDHTYHEHLSYQRNPYSSGFVLNEPGVNAVVSLGWSL